jgi:hypothetical protein
MPCDTLVVRAISAARRPGMQALRLVGTPDQRQAALAGCVISLCLGQPFTHTRVGTPRVQHAFDGGHFVAPLQRGTAGHHGFLVPAQTPGDLGQGFGVTLEGHQFGECGHGLAPEIGSGWRVDGSREYACTYTAALFPEIIRTTMQQVRLGHSELFVTPICLGTMTFGEQVDEPTAHAVLDRSLAAGINFIDTAEMYSVPTRAETYGITETIIGNWFARNRGARQKLVLASKAAGPSRGMAWMRDHHDAGRDRGCLRWFTAGACRPM